MATRDEITNRFDKIDEKLDKVISMQGEMNVTLATQQVILDEHQRRSLASEKRIAPLEEHVAEVRTIGKVIMWAGAAVVGLASILAVVFAI